MLCLTRKISSMLTIAPLTILALALIVSPGAAKDKIKASTIDDLPRHTYEITVKPSEIITSAEEFAKLAAQIKKNALVDLDTYEIEDKTTLQRYYNTLQILCFLEGDYDTSLEYLEKARALEEKEAQKIAMGLVGLSYIDALEAERDTRSEAFRAALRENMRRRLEAMPWEKVQDIFKALNGQMQILSEDLLTGVAQSRLDPAVEKTGNLSGEQATQIVMFRSALDHILPYKEDISLVLGEAIAAHKVEKEDIWPERDVALAEGEDYPPVVIGIWDAGVDSHVFEDHLFTNPREKKDGTDTDGNGYVDDIHGIAFDLQCDPTPGLLYPLGDQEKDRRMLEDRIKGFTDVTASVDSPEAAEIREIMSELEPDDVTAFIEGLTLYTYHSHGTHVAGIAVAGNPYARVLIARLSFDHHVLPQPYTKELMEKFGRSWLKTVEYFKANDVRVVNMSWVIGLREIEHNLEANGIGETAEARGELAREMFDICEKDLYEAIKDAPGILFVGGAGNSDNDVEFDLFVPPAFEFPNLVIAGAVDQAGEPAGFTSFGRTVQVYSNGFEVESFVPGGRRMKFSGTSMAAPNVTNLAAKLIARDPSLTPQEVIGLIRENADDMGTEDRPIPVINPKRSMELLEQKLSKR